MRYLFRFEAEHLLIRAGFEIAHLYADYDRTRTVRSTPVSSCSWQERRDREHAAEQAFAADEGGVIISRLG